MEYSTFDKPVLPEKAVLNPNYLSLPSAWDSSVSQIEMLQRMLYNVNQIIDVLTVYAKNMDEIESEYTDISSKYNDLRDELVAMIDGFETDITEKVDAEIARMEAIFADLDTRYSDLVKQAIDDYTKHIIMFGLTDDGHFVTEYSDSWNDLTFHTTGYDIDLPVQPNFGHLVLSY